MKNVGAVPATYLVFELHTPATVAHHRRHAEAVRQEKLTEKQRRKAEEQRRKRGVRGLLRKLGQSGNETVR